MPIDLTGIQNVGEFYNHHSNTATRFPLDETPEVFVSDAEQHNTAFETSLA